MKKIKDFLNNGKLDYKAYADYLLAALTALSENEETLRSIYSKNGNDQPYEETATENMIQNCKGMLNELQIQKKAGYPEKDKEFWNSLHYFCQSFQDWKNSLARSSGNEEFLLDKYSFEIPGEDSVDFESFFNADLFGEDTLRTYSGIKQPEPEKIIAKDTDFYSLFENGEADAELFPNDLPDPEDIHQTTDGTCYMLASLRSLARSNPHMLKAAFRDITKDTVTVRFYSQWENPRVPVDVTVSRNCIAGVDTDCAPWVRLFEKAYAVYRARKVDYDTEKKINIRKIFNYDAPSFLNALLPTEYRNDPTANVVEKQPSFKDGKKKFSELLKSAQGTDIKTVMTLTTGKHVLDMTKVAEENGTTYVYYIDQMATEPEENRISVDRLFSPDCQFDTISVIQLNGNTPAKHISFYPEHNKKRLTELDGSMNYDSFAKDMTELLVSEVTNRFKAKGKYVSIENPVSQFARKDVGIEDFLKNEFYQNFRKHVSKYKTYREFLNKCNPPEGPESPIKGIIDRMVVQLSSDLKDKKKGGLASELEQVFKAPVNKPAEPKAQEEAIKPQPKQEEHAEPKAQEEAIKPQPKQEEEIKPQPKQEEEIKPQPKQEEEIKPQPKQELVERLKATSSSIDKQEEKWRSFAEKQTDNDLQYFTNWGADAVTYVRDCFKDINAGNIINLKAVETFDEKLETYASIAVILKFLEGLASGESGIDNLYGTRLKITSTKAFKEIHKNLLNNPERLIEFLTNPDKELEQLLQDNDIKELLNKQPQKNMQEEVIDPQPEETLQPGQSYYNINDNDDDEAEAEENKVPKKTKSGAGYNVFSKEGMKMLTSWLDKIIYSQDSKDIQNTKDFSYIMKNGLFAKHFDSFEDSKRIEKINRGDNSTSSQDERSLIGSILKVNFSIIDDLFSALNRGDIDLFKERLDSSLSISAYDYHDSLYQLASINHLNKNELHVGFAVHSAIDAIHEAVEDNISITEDWLAQKSSEVDELVKKEERFYNQMMSDVVNPMSDIAAAIKAFNNTVRANYEKAGKTCPDKALIKIEEVDQYFAENEKKITDFRVAIFRHAGRHGLQSITKKLLDAREYAIQDGMGDGLNAPQFDYLANYQPKEIFDMDEYAGPELEEPKPQQEEPEQKQEEPKPQQEEPEQKQYSQPVGFVPIDQVNMGPSVPIDQIKIGPSVPIDQFKEPEPQQGDSGQQLEENIDEPIMDPNNLGNQIKIGPSVPIDQVKGTELQQGDSGQQLEENIDEPIMDPNDLSNQIKIGPSVPIDQFKEPELQQDDSGQQLEDNIDDVIMDPNNLSNQTKIGPSVPITQFVKKPPTKEDAAEELVKEINSELITSLCELKNAKTVVNSGQYKDLIQTMEKVAKAPLIQSNFEASMTELAGKIDDYLNHKAADGVKTNTYKKLAAVQKANLWVCKGLGNFQKKRPSCYAQARTVYKGDKTGLPDANEVVNYKGIADKLSKKDPDINEATVENVDDCIRMIILKAEPKNRHELNGVRDTFNLVAAPKLNKTADPVKTDKQKTI